MTNSQIRRLVAPALVVAALAPVGSALAAARPDDRPGLHGVGTTSGSIQVRPDDRVGIRGVGSTTVTASVRPDDRPGIRGVGVTSGASVRPDDRPGFRGIGDVAVGKNPSGIATDAFDWRAAGAGAASAVGLMMLLGGAALSQRRSHRRAGTTA